MIERVWRGDEVECLVFTFKEGLLSAVAHDLKLKATAASLTVSGGVVSLRVEAASLRVVCARQGDQDAPGVLSDKDRAKIEKNICEDVLDARRFADVTFRSTKAEARGEGWWVEGDLSLHGVTRRISAEVKRQGAHWVAEVSLHQPDYGIKPYSAMLGALKVQAGVKVVVRAAA